MGGILSILKAISPAIKYITELSVVSTMIVYLSQANLTQLMLGVVIILLAAFLPDLSRKKERHNEAEMETKGLRFSLRGGGRFLVAVAGLILIVTSIFY